MHARGYIFQTMLFGLFGTSIWLVSCDSAREVQGPRPRKALSKVSGKITVNGQAVKDLQIYATPIGGDVDDPHMGNAKTDEEGNFRFTTYEANDGLPAGEHVMVISKPEFVFINARWEGDDFGGKYADKEKNMKDPKFKFLVTAGQDLALEPIDLVVEEGTKGIKPAISGQR